MLRRFTPIGLFVLAALASCSNVSDSDAGVANEDQMTEGSSLNGAGMEANAAPGADAGTQTAQADSDQWKDGDTIPSGKAGVRDIQILKVHKNGSGPVCGTGKNATLKYKAMLANGSVLDPGTRPFSFAVGQRQAIEGWDIVVARMRIGDSFTILLPQELAYGPSKGDLKFDMELLSVR